MLWQERLEYVRGQSFALAMMSGRSLRNFRLQKLLKGRTHCDIVVYLLIVLRGNRASVVAFEPQSFAAADAAMNWHKAVGRCFYEPKTNEREEQKEELSLEAGTINST
jgi:hypothetical protein